MRWLVAIVLLVVALGALCWPQKDTELAVNNRVSSVPSRERLSAEGTAPPPTTTTTHQRASRSRPRPPVTPRARTAPTYSGDWAALIASLPWDVNTAFRIVRCESGGNPNAKNPRSSATGLFQILRGPYDPIANVRLAFAMWQKRGWQPWNASRHCWA